MAFLSRLIRETYIAVSLVSLRLLARPCYVAVAGCRTAGFLGGHARSDNYAAVLRLQRTQPKDRRIYTAPFQESLQCGSLRRHTNRTGQEPQGHKADGNASPESYEINN